MTDMLLSIWRTKNGKTRWIWIISNNSSKSLRMDSRHAVKAKIIVVHSYLYSHNMAEIRMRGLNSSLLPSRCGSCHSPLLSVPCN